VAEDPAIVEQKRLARLAKREAVRAELERELNGGAAPSPAPAAAASPKKGAKGAKAVVAAPAPAAAAKTETPKYTYEVHVRRRNVTIEVTLHKVPEKFINIDETTNERFVVDTTKYTKKYRLDFPFPDGLTVDAARGEYTIEYGVLKAVLPVVNMPASIETEIKGILDSCRADRRKRFAVSKDGESVVRTRTRSLNMGASTDMMRQAAARRRARDEDASGSDVEVDEKEKAKQAALARKAIRKGAAPLPESGSDDEGDAPAKAAPAPAKAKGAPVVTAVDEATKRIAAQVSAGAQSQLKEKVNQMRTLQAARLAKEADSAAKASAKAAVKQESFARLLAEKTKRLREAEAAAAPVPAAASTGRKVAFRD
jgi:hypothetical protein